MKHLQGDWREIAQALPQGSKVRTRCSDQCGKDNSQIVSHTIKGISRKCFRCGASEFEFHGTRPIALIERHKKERAVLHSKETKLPADYSIDVPPSAAVWYYQYGISAELARLYGIGYTEELDRVVLPVFEDGVLTAVQMRAVDPNRKPKYLNPEGPKVSSALFQSAPGTGVTVVTEDILSAIKVGRVHHATSTLGTNMTDARAAKIASRFHKAFLWYDGDRAGRKGLLRAKNQLTLLGVEVVQIKTENDPKTYSLDEIRSILYD